MTQPSQIGDGGPPAHLKSLGLCAGSTGQLRARGDDSQDPFWSPWGGSLQALTSREKNKSLHQQGQASGVKPDVALKMKLPSDAQAWLEWEICIQFNRLTTCPTLCSMRI